MKLIIGLGNPGDKYKNTRHNLGFEVVDALARQLMVNGSWFIDKKFNSEILEINQLPASTQRGEPTTNYKLLLVKPQTFMNDSGIAVKLLSTYYKLPQPKAGRPLDEVTDIIVIHDDLDIPLGKIKIRQGGSGAGHHGVESIIEKLGTDQFIRVRLGIEPSSGIIHNPEKFVLESFESQEKGKVKEMLKKAVDAVETLLEKGLEQAQNQYN